MPMWRNTINDDGTIIQVVPIQDDTEHDGPDCVCGPDLEGIAGGSILIIRHHSLDGRETTEEEPAEQPNPRVDSVVVTLTHHPDGGISFKTVTDEGMSIPTTIGMLITLTDMVDERIDELREIEKD